MACLLLGSVASSMGVMSLCGRLVTLPKLKLVGCCSDSKDLALHPPFLCHIVESFPASCTEHTSSLSQLTSFLLSTETKDQYHSPPHVLFSPQTTLYFPHQDVSPFDINLFWSLILVSFVGMLLVGLSLFVSPLSCFL